MSAEFWIFCGVLFGMLGLAFGFIFLSDFEKFKKK